MSNNSSSALVNASYVPVSAYTPPYVALIEFKKDITDIKGIDQILENARRTIACRLFGYTVKRVSDMKDRTPLPLFEEDMDTPNGKIVLYDPDIPYDAPGYLAAKKEKARSGRWPKNVSRPQRMAVITNPFMLGPRSKPNGLGNNQDTVDNKPIKEGDQKRSVLTNAYPPFSCLVATPSSSDSKPHNIELDNLVRFVSNFRRSVCEYLCTHQSIKFKSESNDEKMKQVNIDLLKMRGACENRDEKTKFAAYDQFLARFCHANIKTPKPRSGGAEKTQPAPMTIEEELRALQESQAQEITRFTGQEYVVFRSRVGFPKKENGFKPPGAVESIHRNPLIRARLAEIDAAVKGGFAYSVPLIYYLNIRTKQWTQMTPEEADSNWPDKRKLIVSVVTSPEFTSNGGPGMTMVRLPITALFIWGEAGAHVPDNYGGGVATAGEEISDADAIAILDGLGTTDNPENAADGFNHMPQADSGQERRGTKRGLGDNGDDPQATKRAATDLTEGMSPFDFEY